MKIIQKTFIDVITCQRWTIFFFWRPLYNPSLWLGCKTVRKWHSICRQCFCIVAGKMNNVLADFFSRQGRLEVSSISAWEDRQRRWLMHPQHRLGHSKGWRQSLKNLWLLEFWWHLVIALNTAVIEAVLAIKNNRGNFSYLYIMTKNGYGRSVLTKVSVEQAIISVIISIKCREFTEWLGVESFTVVPLAHW